MENCDCCGWLTANTRTKIIFFIPALPAGITKTWRQKFSGACYWRWWMRRTIWLPIFLYHLILSISSIQFQEIEIKNQSGQSLSYAFIQFDNIRSVVTALREMDGEHIGGSKIKVTIESEERLACSYCRYLCMRCWVKSTESVTCLPITTR